MEPLHLQSIVIDGIDRRLGCLPTPLELRETFRILGDTDTIPLVPRSEWKPVELVDPTWMVFDQGSYSSCTANAACQALQCLLALMGRRQHQLYPGNLYGRINGGADSGASLGSALRALIADGVCPLPNSQTNDQAWRSRDWPDDWQKQARGFRILEAFYCPSFDHLASAAQKGFASVLGIYVGRNFSVGSDGWIGTYTGGSGGHAICGLPGLYRHEKRRRWGIKIANSWGRDWGDNGYGIIDESYFHGQFSDAWACRGAVYASQGAS